MFYDLKKRFVIFLMKLWESIPDENNLALQEFFNQKRYTSATPEEQKLFRRQSSQFRWDYEESRSFFDIFFPEQMTDVKGKSILDVGCFSGGRLIYWKCRFGFGDATGMDIDPIYAEAGKEYAEFKNIDAKFHTCFAEKMPFPSDSFDCVVNFDVFEHVANLEKSMEECWRVLKSGGKMYVVFPQFYQPLEAHFELVTRMPALHWLFSPKLLSDAYYEIEKNRGEAAYWYARGNPKQFRDWEKLKSLNGTTIRKFNKLLKKQNWKVVFENKKPIFTDGRKSRLLFFRILSLLFVIPARLPILQELFRSRICCILEKQSP
jgi:ubiquinone/menaquinone biosynthesis C-methylase UbiE